MKLRNSLYMSPDLRQSLDLDNFVSKPSKNSDLPSIEDIFVAKRSYDFVLHTQPAQGCFFHFWAPKCSGGCPDNSQTPWSHRISPRRDPRSEPAQIQLLGILAPWDSTIFAQKISLHQLWWLSTWFSLNRTHFWCWNRLFTYNSSAEESENHFFVFFFLALSFDFTTVNLIRKDIHARLELNWLTMTHWPTGTDSHLQWIYLLPTPSFQFHENTPPPSSKTMEKKGRYFDDFALMKINLMKNQVNPPSSESWKQNQHD